MQTNLAHMLDGWMARHELLPRERAGNMAAVIARQCARCAPLRHRGGSVDVAHHWVAARLVAVVFCFEYLTHAQEHPDPFGQLGKVVAAARAGEDAAFGNPWLLAVSDLFLSLIGPGHRDIEAFTAAFEDLVEALREKAGLAAAGLDAARQRASCCAAIDDCLRLRSLLGGTETYLRCWQTLLDCWPGPSFERAVASLAPEVRRAYPHAGLDHALALASTACARGSRRRAARLSEIDALAAVAIYLANDLASVDRDRRSGGPDQELNIVLLVERHFDAPAHVRADLWDDGASSLPAPRRAEEAAVGLYNILVARFRALRKLLLASDDGGDDDARAYLLLLARTIDGHLQGTIELAAERVSTASAGEPAPSGQHLAPRYGSISTLTLLRFIDDGQ